jgi:hypothetical protein
MGDFCISEKFEFADVSFALCEIQIVVDAHFHLNEVVEGVSVIAV